MAVQLPSGFLITAQEAVDNRLVLTKEEMLLTKAARMPDVYFAICKDDGRIYTYNKENSLDSETGRFRVLETNEQVNAYSGIKKIKNFLYEVEYDNLDYNYALDYFTTKFEGSVAGCSSVKKDNFYGRNLDWTYDNKAELIIKTPRHLGRYSTIGVISTMTSLTEELVSSGKYSDAFKIAPFYTVDGINEYGLVVNTNVVPLEDDRIPTTGTTPDIRRELSLCGTMIPRFILDNFKTANEAVNYLNNYVSIYMPAHLRDLGYEAHYMVADKNNTYIIEFVDNDLVISRKSIMTNFYIDDVLFNEDGSVYTPGTQTASYDAIKTNNVTKHGSGLERFNLINAAYNSLASKEDMKNLMNSLKYTNAYLENKNWYTEFVGVNDRGEDLTCASKPVEFNNYIIPKAQELYRNRSRATGLTWQTVHTSIYDLVNYKLYLETQEDGHEYEFGFDYFTAEQVLKMISTVVDAKVKTTVEEVLEEEAAPIAKSGNVKDLIQDEEDILILQCN